jgi:hypothetical protein
MASGKRMFRVAVEAQTDSEAVNAARFSSIYNDPSVRKLSLTILSSWLGKPEVLPAPIVEAPVVPYEETPDSDSGLPPKASVHDDRMPF